MSKRCIVKRKSTVALRVILTVLSVLAVGLIFYNSSLDASESSEQSGALLEAVNAFLRSIGIGVELSEHLIRKTAHFVEYFVLGVLLNGTWHAYIESCRRAPMLASACGFVVAVCDELIQLTSAGRSCEVADMALDFSAVVCASLVTALVLYTAQRRKNRKEGNDCE